MRIERILTREYWNSTKSYIDGEFSIYNTDPIIKLKPTNKFKLTFTGNWINYQYVSPAYYHPIVMLALRNLGGIDTKTTSQISGEPINNNMYFATVGTRRAVPIQGQPETNNYYSNQVEPFVLMLDEYPTSFESIATFLFGSVATGLATTIYGFTIKIEELSYDTPIWYEPKVKQIYQQTFNGLIATADNPFTEFYFNRYIKKSHQNRWRCSLINQSINSISAGIQYVQTLVRLNIPETNAKLIFSEYPQFYPVVIDMTLSTGGNSGTTNNILVRWLYEDDTYSEYEIVAVAPPAGSVIDITFYPVNPPSDDMELIVGAQLTCSGTDGYEILSISINGIASANVGWIDTNSTVGHPAFRDYPVVITNLNLDAFQNSIGGGAFSARMTNNWTENAEQYVPNQWIMNNINGTPFQASSARIVGGGGLQSSSYKPMSFTIQIEEIEDE